MSDVQREDAAVPLLRVEDMLTQEEQVELRRDLALMAKQRRAAEAYAAGFVMCDGRQFGRQLQSGDS